MRRQSITIRFLFACLAALSLAGAAFAQETRATLIGQVSDQGGGAIAGAAVTAVNVETNVAARSTTNEAGRYELPFLLPGQYELRVEVQGFKQYVRRGLTLNVSSRVEADVRMEVGDTAESVTVTSSAPLLETATASSGGVVDNRRLNELPSLFNNATTLSALIPGMHSAGINRADPRSHGSGSDYSVAGGVGGNEWSLDGTPNQGRTRRNAYMPATDGVAEFRVVTNSFDAGEGHSSGAFVSLISKSGTNAYHGTLTGTYQNQRWNATPWADNRSYWGAIKAAEARGDAAAERLRAQPRQSPGRNYTYAGTIGGPVRIPKLFDGQDRLFFFFMVNGFDSRQAQNADEFRTLTVPTEAMRRGDFSALLNTQFPGLTPEQSRIEAANRFQIYNPFTTRAVTSGGSTIFVRDPFPNNIIPASLIRNPMADFYGKLYPLPNQAGTPEGRRNFFGFVPANIPYTAYQNRIDYNATEKDKFFGRWNYYTTVEDGEDWTYTTRRGLQSLAKLRQNVGVGIDYVRTFNATTILNISTAYSQYRETLGSQSAVKNSLKPTDVGLPSYLDQKAGDNHHLPIVDFDAYRDVSAGIGRPERYSVGTLKAELTKIVGRHSLRTGWDGRMYYGAINSPGNTSGSFQFRNTLLRENSTAGARGSDSLIEYAAFLMGLPTSMSVETRDSFYNSTPYQGIYVQDKFSFSRKLTLELGLRYEYEGSIRERFNRGLRDFDFNAQLPFTSAAQAAYARNPLPEVSAAHGELRGGSNYLGVNTAETLTRPVHNWMPRFGFAYLLNDKTVVRGGYGVYYDTLNAAIVTGLNQLGYSRTTTNTVTNQDLASGRFTATGPIPLSDPFPVRADGTRFGNALGLSAVAGRDFTFSNPDSRPLRQQRWRLSVERQLGKDMLASIAYSGSVARGVGVTRNLNALPEQYWSSGLVRDQATNTRLTGIVTNPFFSGNLGELQTQNPTLYQQLIAVDTFRLNTIARQRLLRPYPHLGNLQMERDPLGKNSYHAMIVEFQRRMSHGLQLNTHYEFSHTMDKDWFQNEFDQSPVWREDENGRPHRWVMTAIWELPVGKGRPLLNRAGALNAALGGWQIGAIGLVQSGTPLEFGNVFYYGDDLRAIRLSGDQQSRDRWFNTDLFEKATTRTPLGFHRRVFPSRFNWLRGPLRKELDLNIQKEFLITETVKTTLRFDLANALNYQGLANPVVNPTSLDFGRVVAAQVNPRRLQLQLRVSF
jgi:hypothetical protein